MKNEEANAQTALTLLNRLKTELPEVFNQAQVVGQWVWLEFNVPPSPEIRNQIRAMGFHWNRKRQCWQHPCDARRRRTRVDPRSTYPVTPAAAMELKETPPSAAGLFNAKEYKVVALRECPLPESLALCDTPDRAVEYWRLHVATHPYFSPDVECFVVLLLNTRRRVKGHQLLTLGTQDTLLVDAKLVFRAAVIAAAAAIVLMHNHPSGEPSPSEADIKVTRDLIRAGQLLKIDVVDHVIVGNPNHSSLRSLGFFYQ